MAAVTQPHSLTTVKMLSSLALLALAAAPAALAQISNDFESGWDQSAWPTYAPDCNQVGSIPPMAERRI